MIFLKSKRLEKKTSDAREPSLYRSICTSIISTLLSLVMLVGTTFAWFTDNLTTGVFTITAGSLAAQASYCTELPDGSSSSEPVWLRLNPGNTSMFGGMTFTPGTSQTAYLRLENKNDDDNVAAVKYMFSFEDVAASPVALTAEEGVTTQSLGDALTFTCKTASSIDELTDAATETVTTETRTLSAFDSNEEGQAGPFVVEVDKNAPMYVALTISMNGIEGVSITPSSIQLRLKIIITNAGEESEENIKSQQNEFMAIPEPEVGTVVTEIENETTAQHPVEGETPAQPADYLQQPAAGKTGSGGSDTAGNDENAGDTDNANETEDSGNADTSDTVVGDAADNADTSDTTDDSSSTDASDGVVDTIADTVTVEPNAADDAPAADSAA